MDAERVCAHRDPFAPRCAQIVFRDRDGLIGGVEWVQQCPRFLSAKQQASTGIAPVCERFIPQVESVLYSQLLGFTVSGCSQHHQFKIGMPTRDGTHDVVQNQGISQHGVVQRTVGFDIGHSGAMSASDTIKRANLVMHEVDEFLSAECHGPSPEALLVGV